MIITVKGKKGKKKDYTHEVKSDRQTSKGKERKKAGDNYPAIQATRGGQAGYLIPHETETQKDCDRGNEKSINNPTEDSSS